MSTEYISYQFELPYNTTFECRVEPNATLSFILRSPVSEQYHNTGVMMACKILSAGAGLMSLVVAKSPQAVSAVMFLTNKGCTKLAEENFFANDLSGIEGGSDSGSGIGNDYGYSHSGDYFYIPPYTGGPRPGGYWQPLNPSRETDPDSAALTTTSGEAQSMSLPPELLELLVRAEEQTNESPPLPQSVDILCVGAPAPELVL